jgi:DNA-directed RNA polymerase specialized sigma subunit
MADKINDPKNLMHYLLVTHAPLIHQSIRSLKKAGKIPEDMEDWEFHEQGIRGLMEAVRAYNPEVAQRTMPDSKNPFSTFAQSRIRGRIQDHADSLHQIPKHIRQQAKRFTAQEQKPAAPEIPGAPVKTNEE